MTRAFCITARLRSNVATFMAGTVCWLHRDHDPASGQVKMMFRRRGLTPDVIDIAKAGLIAIEIRVSSSKPSVRWEGNREQAMAMALLLIERHPGSHGTGHGKTGQLAGLPPISLATADSRLQSAAGYPLASGDAMQTG